MPYIDLNPARLYMCSPYIKMANCTFESESESEIAQSCLTLCDPMDCSLSGSSVHGIFQARVLEWIAISFSRGSSQPRNRIRVSRIAGRCFTVWVPPQKIPIRERILRRWQSTRRLSSYRDNSYTIITYLMEQFWNSGVCWRLATSRGRLGQKIALKLILFKSNSGHNGSNPYLILKYYGR